MRSTIGRGERRLKATPTRRGANRLQAIDGPWIARYKAEPRRRRAGTHLFPTGF